MLRSVVHFLYFAANDSLTLHTFHLMAIGRENRN